MAVGPPGEHGAPFSAAHRHTFEKEAAVYLFRKLSLSVCVFWLTFSSVSLASAQQTLTGPGRPSTVLQYEPVTPITTATSALSDQEATAQGSLEISLYAYGRRFDLVLEPNHIFSDNAENMWINGHTQTTEAPTMTFYKGTVKDEPGSWVRVSLRDGSLDGMIWTQKEIYFLEPGTRFFSGTDTPPYGTVIYRMSDTTSTWDLGSCALETPSLAFKLEGHGQQYNAFGDYSELTSHLQELAAAGTLKQLEIALVADYEYYQEHGENSATDMQNVLNQIDGIYRSELGVTLHVAGTVVFTSAADPFSNTTDPVALLQEFSNYRSSTSGVVRTAGLAHLFTNRDIDSNVIGIAWLGTLCSSYYGTGLSQDFTSENKSLVLLTAHEIGHNFNAPHDNQGGSACASTPFGYIMNPWVSTSLALQFSSCSKDQIAPEIAGASCLSTVPDGGSGTPSCSFSISPSSRAHNAQAAAGSVTLSTGDTCDWTAQSNKDWITITSSDSGAGAGQIGYAIEANPGPGSRTGTLTIAGKTFTISQAAPCTYSLASSARTFRGRGGSSSVQIRTDKTCGWEADSDTDWITILTPSGTGKKTIRYGVSKNTTGSVRIGSFTVEGQTFTVTQNP